MTFIRKSLYLGTTMAPAIFIATAILFWFFFLTRLFLLRQSMAWLNQLSNVGEKVGYILFTLGLGLYIYYFHEHQDSWIVQSMSEKKPISWLLFTWCIYSAQILVEISYNCLSTKIFANFWVAAALTFLPNSSPQKIHAIFSGDSDWLSFHRLSFLLGYGFCVLAIPLSILFLWQHAKISRLTEEDQILEQRQLWMLDRMQYRMILWALPLLTLGIVVESFMLMERGNFPSPTAIWMDQKDSFLALAAWFFCGIYLHTRLFFGWRDVKSSTLFLSAFALVLIGHLSHHFLHFQS